MKFISWCHEKFSLFDYASSELIEICSCELFIDDVLSNILKDIGIKWVGGKNRAPKLHLGLLWKHIKKENESCVGQLYKIRFCECNVTKTKKNMDYWKLNVFVVVNTTDKFIGTMSEFCKIMSRKNVVIDLLFKPNTILSIESNNHTNHCIINKYWGGHASIGFSYVTSQINVIEYNYSRYIFKPKHK